MTVIQQLFNELEQMHPSLFDVHTVKGREFVNHFHKYIELERQQIIDAYEQGEEDGYFHPENGYSKKYKDAEQYYNHKYGK